MNRPSVSNSLHFIDRYPHMDQFTVEHILSNIQIARCIDHIELVAVSHQLPDLIRSHGQVDESQDLYIINN